MNRKETPGVVMKEWEDAGGEEETLAAWGTKREGLQVITLPSIMNLK